MPKNLADPREKYETFGQEGFWRKFARPALRELEEQYRIGTRGLCYRAVVGEVVRQAGGARPATASIDLLRETGAQKHARWVAFLEEAKMHLLVEGKSWCQSELVDGCWFHHWRE